MVSGKDKSIKFIKYGLLRTYKKIFIQAEFISKIKKEPCLIKF